MALLDRPAQQHLAGAATDLRGDASHHGVLEQSVVPPEGAPPLGDDPVLGMEGHCGRPDEIRVAFDLVDLRGHARLGHDPLQVLGLEVGDADRPGPALLAQRDEALPPVDLSLIHI